MEDKKLVANWMGWVFTDPEWMTTLKKPDGTLIYYENWNPQDNDKATFAEWGEIYRNMSYDEFGHYLFIMDMLLDFPEECTTEINKAYLTAEPEIRWKALIQMIKEKE